MNGIGKASVKSLERRDLGKKEGLGERDSSPRYVFISFSGTKWDGPWYVRQKLMAEIARKHKVIYVNPRREIREILGNMLKPRRWSLGVKILNKNLVLIEGPWLFPKIYRLKRVDDIIERFYHRFIKLVAYLVGRDRERILYLWEPAFAPITQQYGRTRYIYHPYDLFEKYTYDQRNDTKGSSTGGARHETDQAVNDEKELVRKAFLFYSVSELLCDHYHEKYGRRPTLIPNGVQDIYFGGGDRVLEEVANKVLERFPSKNIGISGSIIGSLGLDLIIEASPDLPDYTFLFIGPVRYTHIKRYDEKLDRLFALKNVFHLGPFRVELLPYLLRRMDLLVMIYRNDKSIWTHYGSPSKLFEYMAVGKPIVSTPHPAIRAYQRYVAIVEEAAEFVSAVRGVEKSRDDQILHEMVEVARMNTWEEREKLILQDLRENLAPSTARTDR